VCASGLPRAWGELPSADTQSEWATTARSCRSAGAGRRAVVEDRGATAEHPDTPRRTRAAAAPRCGCRCRDGAARLSWPQHGDDRLARNHLPACRQVFRVSTTETRLVRQSTFQPSRLPALVPTVVLPAHPDTVCTAAEGPCGHTPDLCRSGAAVEHSDAARARGGTRGGGVQQSPEGVASPCQAGHGAAIASCAPTGFPPAQPLVRPCNSYHLRPGTTQRGHGWPAVDAGGS